MTANCCIKRTDLRYEYKESYQSLVDKGYIHEMDKTHTLYNKYPVTREEAEKLAADLGWVKTRG